MKCPVCGGSTGIYNSRPEVDCVRRSRKCDDCGFRFRTIEIETDMMEAWENSHKIDIDVTDVKKAVQLLNKFVEGVTK